MHAFSHRNNQQTWVIMVACELPERLKRGFKFYRCFPGCIQAAVVAARLDLAEDLFFHPMHPLLAKKRLLIILTLLIIKKRLPRQVLLRIWDVSRRKSFLLYRLPASSFRSEAHLENPNCLLRHPLPTLTLPRFLFFHIDSQSMR